MGSGSKMSKAILKFNGGNLAILCSACSVIIKTGKDFTPEELDFSLGKCNLVAQYCINCKNKQDGKVQS